MLVLSKLSAWDFTRTLNPPAGINFDKNTWPWNCYLRPPGQVAPATVWILPSSGPKPVIPVIPKSLSASIHVRGLTAGKGIPDVKLGLGMLLSDLTLMVCNNLGVCLAFCSSCLFSCVCWAFGNAASDQAQKWTRSHKKKTNPAIVFCGIANRSLMLLKDFWLWNSLLFSMCEMLAVTTRTINYVKSLICQSWGITTKSEIFSASNALVEKAKRRVKSRIFKAV